MQECVSIKDYVDMRFEITAKTNMIFNGQRAIERGDTFTINIPNGAVRPSTLLTSTYRDEAAKQLRNQGIPMPPSGYWGSGWWDVKVK